MKTRVVIIAYLVTALLSACASAPGIQGRVTDQDGHPLAGLPVLLDHSVSGGLTDNKGAQTDANGEYHFEDQPTNTYTITIAWRNNPSCPTLTGASQFSVVNDFLVTYTTQGFGSAFIAVKEFEYETGKATRLDLKIPCTGEAPGLAPTVDPLVTIASPVPASPAPTSISATEFAATRAAAMTSGPPTDEPLESSTAVVIGCPTPISETATAFANLGAGEQSNPSADLTDTRWTVTASDGYTYELVFRPNGILDGSTSDITVGFMLFCSNWRQVGDAVYMNLSFGTSNWEGHINGGNMQGSASGINGTSWTWNATRH